MITKGHLEYGIGYEYTSEVGVHWSTARVGENLLRNPRQEPEIAEHDGQITRYEFTVHSLSLSAMRLIDIITVLSLALSASCKLETEGIKLPLPTRDLEWKDVNFLSISDSHGR